MSKKPFEEKTGVGKFLTFRWVKKLFAHIDDNLIQAAVKITEAIKDGLYSPLTGWITSVIPGDIDDKIVAWAKPAILKVLASELLLKDVVDNPTEEDIQALGEEIRQAFGGLPDDKKGKFYTSVAAELGVFFHEQAGTKITFGEAAAEAEILWQKWQNTLNDGE